MRRKLVLFAIVSIFTIFLLGSCKSTSHCPAYSEVELEQADQNV